MDRLNSQVVEWGVAGRQMPGETISGDMHLVKPTDRGVLVAVADGLGHGRGAAEAAELALNTVERRAEEPLDRLFNHCNESLRRTRGVVMSLACFNALDHTMEWLGVGNVVGLLMRRATGGTRPAREILVPSAGVVGTRLPPLRTAVLSVSPGDTLVFATDGIRSGFEEEMFLFAGPEKTAQGILARDDLGTDDALVLVATYKGRPR